MVSNAIIFEEVTEFVPVAIKISLATKFPLCETKPSNCAELEIIPFVANKHPVNEVAVTEPSTLPNL